ncbi:MAG: glycine cleavage system aminomethyltransferase GcvT [Candidatus Thermoplasmatota archaeon]
MALRTALYDWHAAHGATFVPFAGYDMPVHYGSIKAEHAAVRTAAGLFDVSHMSNLWVSGPKAASALARVTPSNPAVVPLARGKYTVILNADGTILDDAFYFKVAEDRFYVIPNAGRNVAVGDALRSEGAAVEDVTAATSIFALQGPKAKEILAAASSDAAPKFHHLTTMRIAGVECLVSGTGYTGEKGVELYLPAAQSVAVWEHLMAVGASHGLASIGLGARDTLRLEKGYCLAGNEFEGGRTPIEAGLAWVMDWNGDFHGKSHLRVQMESGDHDRLVGLVQESGIPRHGYPILRDGSRIGQVTSGTISPTTGKGIALGYVRGAAVGDEVAVEVRGKAQSANVVKPPFV